MKIGKILALILLNLMIFSQIPVSVSAEGETLDLPKDGSWYLINTAEDLYKFADYMNKSKEKYIYARLTADITVNKGVSYEYDEASGKIKVEKDGKTAYVGSGLCDTKRGEWSGDKIELKKWNPISAEYLRFDGNGHTVDGIFVEGSSDYSYAGLFGSMTVGYIRNLTLGERSLIINTVSGRATGGIVAYTYDCSVSACKNYALVCGISSARPYLTGGTGGIAGVCRASVSECENYGTILGDGSAGGIAGSMANPRSQGAVLVNKCTNYGNVFAGMDSSAAAGGIVAVASAGNTQKSGMINFCFNHGKITADCVGGILGCGGANARVAQCGNFGTVTGVNYAGGICGAMGVSDNTLSIKGCFNSAEVKLSDNASNSYAHSIYAYYVGNTRIFKVTNCYNDTSRYNKIMLDESADEYDIRKEVMLACYDVTPEVFASGEPAYFMGMFQELENPETEGKVPQTYPDETSVSYVRRNLVYCCHKNRDGCEKAERYVYSNVSATPKTDDHTIGDNGYCTHCGADCRKPIITPETLPDATEREHYTVTFATDGTPTDELAYEIITSETDETAYTLPNGLDIYKSGNRLEIYGNPNEYGNFTFTVKATNKYGSSYKTYTLVINKNDTEAFEITTKELPDGTVGEYYSCSLEISDPKNLAYWSLIKGSVLPKGIEFDEKSGMFFGTPEETGTFDVNVEAWSINKDWAGAKLTLKINSIKNKLDYDGKTLFITCAEAGEYTIIYEHYENGRLADIRAVTQKFGEGNNTVKEFPFELANGDKIYFWENLISARPLCEAYTIKK